MNPTISHGSEDGKIPKTPRQLDDQKSRARAVQDFLQVFKLSANNANPPLIITKYNNNTQVVPPAERWGAGVKTQKMVRGEIGGWGRVPFNETYAPSLSTIYDGA